jgi:c-di-GMP-binding flagellar brake protein YcgR
VEVPLDSLAGAGYTGPGRRSRTQPSGGIALKQREERRRAHRVDARLSMEVSLETSSAGTKTVETLNVSANGVYFAADHYIEPMTRIEVALVIPEEGGEGRRITCQGLVVRTEPETYDPRVDQYNVACFFTHIPDSERRRLEEYILQHMPL